MFYVISFPDANYLKSDAFMTSIVEKFMYILVLFGSFMYPDLNTYSIKGEDN